MIEKALFEISHLKVVLLKNGKYCLIIEDDEVCDFVEDFLSNNYNIDADSIQRDCGKEINIYFQYFEPDFDIQILVRALKTIDGVEVEKFFKLNN